MRIEDIRLETREQRSRVAAKVTWEDSGRAPQEVYFEVEQQFADALSSSPDAFLMPCAMAALKHGEQRISWQGEACPHLLSGLGNAMALIRHWYGGGRKRVALEGMKRTRPAPPSSERAAFFMTGGIDSLATLRTNQLTYPREHPACARDGILIFGLEVADPDAFQHVVDHMTQLAGLAGFTLLPVYTNVRYLDDDWVFWVNEFEASVLSSAAHALGRRLSTVFIGSSFDYPHLHPHGSHPLLDYNFSSHELRIHHDGVALSRFEKTRILADWDIALPHLRVCNKAEHYRSGVLNCGRCEKCLRTLTALLLLDKAADTRTFANTEVTPELLRSAVYISQTEFPFWDEMLGPLEQKGRGDLIEALEPALKRYRGETGWKGRLRRFDRMHLDGGLQTLERALRGRLTDSGSSKTGVK